MNLTDREIMDDVLSSQKHITGTYNAFTNECVNEQLKNDMLKILTDEHNIQFSIFGDMQKRGWYSPAAAQPQNVTEAKTKFEGIATQL
jgi:spore coat protein CotF